MHRKIFILLIAISNLTKCPQPLWLPQDAWVSRSRREMGQNITSLSDDPMEVDPQAEIEEHSESMDTST